MSTHYIVCYRWKETDSFLPVSPKIEYITIQGTQESIARLIDRAAYYGQEHPEFVVMKVVSERKLLTAEEVQQEVERQ